MTNRILWERLTEVFRETFEDDALEIGPDTTAEDVDAWDSLTHVQLMVAIEETFGIQLNTGEVAGLANVGEMAALIERRSQPIGPRGS